MTLIAQRIGDWHVPRRPCLFVVVLLQAIAFVTSAAAQRIHTIAGNGPNDIVATSANLVQPSGVACDSTGNFYVVSPTQNRVFKTNSSGLLTIVAGQGSYGYSGDKNRGADAELYNPQGIAVDAFGNLYIADTVNERVRVVNTQATPIKVAGLIIQPGSIETIAGNGAYEYNGDGIAATSSELEYPNGVAVDRSGKIYVADTYNQRVRVIGTDGTIDTVAGTGTQGYSGDGQPAAQADLQFPNGVAVDGAGNVYIADTYNQRVRVVNSDGTIRTTAGNGTQGYSGDGGPAAQAELDNPVAVAVDASGNLFIADMGNQRIRFVNTGVKPLSVADVTVQPGNIATIAGVGSQGFSGDGGLALKAELNSPNGVALCGPGNLYIADTDNQRIRLVNVGVSSASSAASLEPGTIGTVAGNGTLSYGGDGESAAGASLYDPEDIAFGLEGSLYVADLDNQRIRVVNTGTKPVTVADVVVRPGNIATIAGVGTPGFSGDGGPATKAELYNPVSVAADNSGSFYIADLDNQRIRFVNAGTKAVTVAKVTVLPGDIATVVGVGTQGFSGDGGLALKAELNNPNAVAVDAAGNLYIADTDNQRIRFVNTGTEPVRLAGVTVQPGFIATIAGTGKKGYGGDGGPPLLADFHYPIGLAFDRSGNLYVADTNNDVIRVLNTTSAAITVAGKAIQPTTIATVAGTGSYDYQGNGLAVSNEGVAATSAPIYDPVGVAVDGAGNIYVSDTYNQRIRKVSPAGIITTIAGTGIYGKTGDNGPAIAAFLAYPYGIKVDDSGRVFFADSGNHRICQIVPAN